MYREAFVRAWVIARKHRDLLWELQRRDLSDRYVGSTLGALWAVVQPLVQLAVYVIVFGFVFKLKFGGQDSGGFDYPAYIIAGYLPWMAIMDVMTRSAIVIYANMNVIKQVAFPTELLPAKVLLGAFVPQAVGIAFLIAYLELRFGRVPVTLVLLPVALVLEYVAAMGLAWILALVGAYFRDLPNVLQVFFLVNLYAMPIVYAPAWTPPVLARVIPFNPFAHLVYVFQDVLFFGAIRHPVSWGVLSLLAAITFAVGFNLFNRAKQAFGNVL